MFPQAVRALREVKPKAFIFENVKGLTRQSFRNYVEYIRLQMRFPEIDLRPDETWSDHHARLEEYESSGDSSGLTYNVLIHHANAANYGVPQRRERVFFVGFRTDLRVAWHFPDATHSADGLAWSQYRDGDYWDRHLVSWQERSFSERARARAWRLEAKPLQMAWRTVRDAFEGLPPPEDREAASEFLSHRIQLGAKV